MVKTNFTQNYCNRGKRVLYVNLGSSWDPALTIGDLWPRSRQGGKWVESYKEETSEVKGVSG